MSGGLSSSVASKLSKLQLQQLKTLAECIGINTSGTKPVLAAGLESALRQPQFQARRATKQPTRILSVDMGIRNLAFCVLEINDTGGLFRQSSPSAQGEILLDKEEISSRSANALDAVKLLTWKRTSLLDLLDSSADQISVQSTASEDDDELVDINGKTKFSKATESAALKEAFDPSTFARLTYMLVTRVFLPYNVSQVLIERQRYRSGGAAAIMEWTVRVNMLESMLHAVFGTLRRAAGDRHLQNNVQQGEEGEEAEDYQSEMFSPTGLLLPTVHSVNPKRVGVFWDDMSNPAVNSNDEMGTTGGGRSKPKRQSSKVEKETKIAIAESWIRKGFPCSPEAEAVRAAFLAARNRKRRRKGSTATSPGLDGIDDISATRLSTSEDLTKLDDLADCLLQGVAWVQWELNRRSIHEALEGDRSRIGAIANERMAF